MKIIFLDIDGVLNHGLGTPNPERPFDPINLAPFNAIIAQTAAKVVVSSSWRTLVGPDDIYKSNDAFFDFLHVEGLRAELIGTTPVLRGEPRGLEIQDWLKDTTGWDDYLIFEDIIDEHMPAAHTLALDTAIGLTWPLAEEAIARLKQGSWPTL